MFQSVRAASCDRAKCQFQTRLFFIIHTEKTKITLFLPNQNHFNLLKMCSHSDDRLHFLPSVNFYCCPLTVCVYVVAAQCNRLTNCRMARSIWTASPIKITHLIKRFLSVPCEKWKHFCFSRLMVYEANFHGFAFFLHKFSSCLCRFLVSIYLILNFIVN